MSGKQLKVPGLSAQRRAERRARMKRLTSYTPKPQRDWRGRIVTAHKRTRAVCGRSPAAC